VGSAVALQIRPENQSGCFVFLKNDYRRWVELGDTFGITKSVARPFQPLFTATFETRIEEPPSSLSPMKEWRGGSRSSEVN
jgi:hypothetical protein